MKQLVQTNYTYTQKIAAYKVLARQGTEHYLLAYGDVLRDYAKYLAENETIANERESAKYAKQAVQVYKKLSQLDTSFKARYAEVLAECSDYLNKNNDDKKAIALADAALAIYKELLADGQDEYLINYAELLKDYAFYLYGSDELTNAITTIKESLAIYKQLVIEDKHTLGSYYEALHIYALCLKPTDKNKVLALFAECIELYDQAPNQHDVSVKAQKVWHLTAYIDELEQVGKHLEVLSVSEKTLVIYKQLIVSNFKKYAGRYASFLVDYANRLEDGVWLGGYDGWYEDSPRIKQAGQLFAEVIEVRENLIKQGARYEYLVHAQTLSRYAVFLKDRDQIDKAVTIAERAIPFAKKIIDSQDTAFIRGVNELEVAEAYKVYAELLAEQGQFQSAVDNILQAVLRSERWIDEVADVYLDEHIDILYDAGWLLSEAGYTSEALVYSEKAVLLAKQKLDKKNSYHNLRSWIYCLNNYINDLAENGDLPQSLELSRELIEKTVKRYEIKKYAGVFPPILVNAYVTYANCLNDNDYKEEALVQIKKALACFGLVYCEDFAYYRKTKAWLLTNLAIFQANLGQITKGLNNLKKAIDIRETLTKEKPALFKDTLAFSNNSYANLLMDVGNYSEALVCKKQALAIYTKYQATAPNYYEAVILFRRFDIMNLNWLLGKRAKLFNEIHIATMDIEDRDKQALNFQQSWLLTCLAKDSTLQRHYAIQTLTYWSAMADDLQKSSFEDYVLLMALFKSRQYPINKRVGMIRNWQVEYKHFIQQRKGHIPEWMLETANKLRIKLPKIVK